MEKADPKATPEALFRAVDAENPPLRLDMGSNTLPWVRGVYEERLARWEEWDTVARSAQVNHIITGKLAGYD